jgi:sugar/nucleoside kinase (ribokinase family)
MPSRALEILAQLKEFDWPTRTCYEPIPDSCTPESLEELLQVLPLVDVFSPNHEEAAGFFEVKEKDWAGTKEEIERLAARFLELGAKDRVVVRSGALGMVGVSREEPMPVWIPAYQTDASKVVDPVSADVVKASCLTSGQTGCGNSSLGGLLAGLSTGNSLKESMIQASVSASFCKTFFSLETR